MMHESPCEVFMNIHQDGTQYMCATLVNTITSFTAARQRDECILYSFQTSSASGN